jgi:DNA-binding LytR/AlgR family response regulator
MDTLEKLQSKPQTYGSSCPVGPPIALRAAVHTQSDGSTTTATGSKSRIFQGDDLVLLTGGSECRLTRIDTILILEASSNGTLVHFAEDTFLIHRSLSECERRLDRSLFFRVNRACIINLSQVRLPRLLSDGGLLFLLRNGKEVVLSRRQSARFRAMRGL